MSREQVIDAELARVILGGRGPARPELRMDFVGHLARMAIAHRFAARDLGSQLAPVLERAVAGLRRFMTAAEEAES